MPPPPPGTKISATPAKPSSTPPAVASAGRSPSTVRMSTIHNGTHAISSAARPESTRCSATLTRPLPPTSSSTPDTEAVTSCARVARSADQPRSATTAPSRIRPAAVNRSPAESSGGTVSTAYRIARYVEPQTT